MIRKGTLNLPNNGCLIGLDAEWTKNYQIKNGNIPFCFSAVSVKNEDLSFQNLQKGTLQFNYLQFYCDNTDDRRNLALQFDSVAGEIVTSLKSCVLCGHQLSSDLSVFVNYARSIGLPQLSSVNELQDYWHKRKQASDIAIFDTRYDINQSFLRKSRRLVDMSNDFLIDVTQPELGHSSMTKLQNLVFANGNSSIRERISVMNLRHSLCAVVLFWLNCQVSKGAPLQNININKTMQSNLLGEFDWINTDIFQDLL